jgi:hypothetical protein
MTVALFKRQKAYVIALALLLGAVPAFSMFGPKVRAADLTQRSVLLGTSVPSAVTTHQFSFNIATASVLGSIQFQYCANSPLFTEPCVAPAGLSLSAASIINQSGATGFSIHPNSTVNNLILTRVPAGALPQPVGYTFDSVTNPSTPNTVFFVRISTYATDDASGAITDKGSLAFSTAGGLGTQAYVPPFLEFCVGVTVAPDCSSTSGSSIDLGELSTTFPKTATSQFAGATNDPGGFSASIMGTTMTSGNNTIPAMAAPTASVPGTSQFGINLRANASPTVGQDPTGVGTSVPNGQYANPNQFAFVSGSQLSASPLPTEYNVFTVSYLVNIASGQAPGVYAMTATYIATAAF